MLILEILGLLILGMALLYFGAEGVVSSGIRLAARCGLTPLAIGLTVVAFGTSSPELAVSIKAALSGSGDIAIGNVVGSNIANIALIIGVCALIRPIKVSTQIIQLDIPLMLLISLIVAAMIGGGSLSRIAGVGLFTALIAYSAFNYFYAKNGAKTTSIEEREDKQPLIKTLLWLIGGLAFLVGGASVFVHGAVKAAKIMGFSEATIGLTIVALGTSLPELATSVVASLKNENDIALGNVVGSNVFNLLGILGVTAMITPLTTSGVGILDIGVMLMTSLALLPIARSGFTISRFEGAFLLAIWCGYIYYLLA